ncbi:MAG TPA: tetratricopeptide repeat protein [Ktedonobacteraceae bacterium]|nr:tetratricopeptide repeat protein [Ktedonobacteraceae bacterium]
MNIELHLARPNSQSAQVTVTCNGTLSHTFDLQTLIPNNTNGLPHPLHDPVTYGKTLYTALFPQDSPAFQALSTKPSRILLVATDDVLDTIPWEYAYGPNGYLACSCSFVRGLPLDQRIAPPTNLNELHIIAVASSPLSHVLAPLNIQGEWTRLTEIVSKQKRTISLERAWPPTIEYLRELVAGQEQLVVHFMGHGGQNGEAVLCFERDDGTREDISASEFVQRLQGSVFLVTLNACQSATPGKTVFSNLAKALIHEQIPYALGMRFSIHDDDARDFSRTFYNDLARGVSVEKALVQARLTLAKSERVWAAGNLVLYTSLTQPAPGYTTARGDPDVRDEQKDALRGIIHELTGVQGAFQGRIDEQIKLGKWLTGDSRPRIIAIHANGGQGKTALARVAAERFAHAWPGGVWAISMETVPTLAVFTASLARFLGINPQENTDQIELEKQILLRLHRQRTLLVLDNLETLDEATKAKDAGAITLIEFIQKLPNERTTILYTSRHLLGLSGEQHLELPGLAPDEGAALFKQSAPNHVKKIDDALARQLSQRVDGHPLGLSLLGKAFNSSSISFQNFLADHEKYLHSAENRFIDVEHRQHKMFANVDYSVRWLSNELRDTFSKLWIFHAPFFPEDAVSILDPEQDETSKASPIEDHLYTLWQRGLLTREPLSESNDSEYVYRLPPVIHPFVEKYMADQSKREELLKRFGEVYAGLAKYIYGQLVQGRAIIGLALLCYDDLTRGWQFVEGIERSRYLLYWGWILHRLSDQRRAIALTEQALELAEGQDRALEGSVLHNLAGISHAIGRTHKALRLYEQALAIRREVGDRSGEGTTLNNLGGVYDDLGQKQQALDYYQQALAIRREVDDRSGEGTTLNNLGGVYNALGQKPQALDYYQQALAIRREVGDRSGEGTTLNNLGRVYNALGQKPQALAYYQQALAIWREVGDRSGEGITLHNIGMIYAGFGQLDVVLACALLAKALFEYVQSPYIEYAKQLINSLRRHLGEERFAALLAQVAPRANEIVERALQEKRLPDEVEQFPSTLPPEQINIIISNTITVMTTMPERRAEWQETISRVLQVAQQRGSDWQIEVEFYTAILAILDGQSLSLPTDHPYASALAAIQEGIANGGQPPDEAEDIPEEVQALIAFVEACVAALRSPDPQEKMAFMQQLATSQAQAEDDEMKILLQKLQLALFGGDLMKLGENLTGFARQVWDMIVAGVQQDDTSSDEEPDTP